MPNKKKILFVNNSLDYGGAERVLVNLVNFLPKDKYEVTLLTMYYSGVYEKLLNKDVKHKYFFKKRGKLFNKIALALLCKILPIKWLYKSKLKEEFDYEVAYLHGYPTEFVRKSSNKKCKRLAFIHADFSKKYLLSETYSTKEDCLKAYKQFDATCFVAQTAKEGFIQTLGEIDNAHVIHNVMDVDEILSKSTEQVEEFKGDNLKLVTVGRLVKIKAVERIINALALLKEHYSNFEYVIVGDGPERQSLEQLIIDKGLSNNVKIVGYCNNPYKYMAKADLYVCSSISEGYSTTVVESIILGVPVLTTDVSGMKEILGETNCGHIVPNTDTAIYDGLKYIFETDGCVADMKENAKQRAKDFTTEAQVKEFLDLIETL